MKTIAIIGAGMMGSALAFPARENGNVVRIVGTHLDRDIIKHCIKHNRHPKFTRDFPTGVSFYQLDQLNEALTGVDFVICGVSSFGVEWFGEKILPVLDASIPVLTVTKGLMNLPDGRLITYPDLWQQKLAEKGKKLCLNAIGGPCTSYELVAHDQTTVSFCGNDMDVLTMLKDAMSTDYYHIRLTTDVIGVESAVALKNGYALGVALSIGLNQREFGINSELHFNSQAAVFGQAVREMALLLKMQGAEGLDNLVVGLGDLYVTVYGGRTRQIGILLGRGMPIQEAKEALNGITLESLVVTERVAKAVKVLAKQGAVDMQNFPLLMHIDEIITEGKPACIPWDSFTDRQYPND